MKIKKSEALPKMLPGTIQKQWIRCGKPACTCAQGQLHGPYAYRFWRENGRLRKEYVRAADVAAVQTACAAWQAAHQHSHQLRSAWQTWRTLQDQIREAERLWKNKAD